MMYADYIYYLDVHGGAMPEEDFRRLARKASAYLDQVTMGRAVSMACDNRIKDACCAVAEEYLAQERGTVVSETNDKHSITMAREEKSGNARLYEAAALYLANTGLLFRGVRCCRC